MKAKILAAMTLAALAVAPATASAVTTGVSAGQYPAVLHGAQEGIVELSAAGAVKKCSGGSFDASLSELSSVLATSSIKDPACAGGALQMNGCKFEFSPVGVGSVAIGPPGCGPVSASMSPCGVFPIPAQAGISATYENVGSGSGAYFNVTIDDPAVEALGTGLCGTKKEAPASLWIHNYTFKVTATNEAKQAIGTTVIANGLFGSGNAEGGLIDATQFPVAVSGERTQDPYSGVVTVINKGKLKIDCNVASYDGGELAEAASSLSLDATYSECKLAGYGTNVTVAMNSCNYVYSGFEYFSEEGLLGDPVQIACNEGDSIKITLPGYTVTIPPQSVGGGETAMANWVSGDEAALLTVSTASGIEFTTTGAVVGKVLGVPPGTYNDGTSEFDMLLRGEF